MAKNCMAAVAKLLGVELDEKFIIARDGQEETVLLATDGFHVLRPNDALGPDRGTLLSMVLQGLYEVKKKPWEPKYGECYYCPSIRQRKVMQPMWAGDTRDYAMKALGMIYRTKAEAEANMAKDYEKLTGKELKGKQEGGK